MSAVLANLAGDVIARFRREGQGAVRDATEEGMRITEAMITAARSRIRITTRWAGRPGTRLHHAGHISLLVAPFTDRRGVAGGYWSLRVELPTRERVGGSGAGRAGDVARRQFPQAGRPRFQRGLFAYRALVVGAIIGVAASDIAGSTVPCRLKPQRLAQRGIDPGLPSGPRLTELRHHVGIEPHAEDSKRS